MNPASSTPPQAPQLQPSPPGPHAARTLFWLPVWTLTQREIIRFVRQRTRVVGALGQPVLLWIFFGAGLRISFQPPDWAPADMTYQEYFFPGVAVLILMFTAIFSTISIIEDRKEGFLQGVLVAPISRSSLVLGKLCGGTLLAVVQALFFLLLGPALKLIGLAPTIDWNLSLIGFLETTAFLILLGFALTGLGYLIAWPLDSTQGFHAVMTVFLMPLWLLSGAFFPTAESGWLAWVMKINPLTYGVAGLRRVMYAHSEFPVAPGLPALNVDLAVTLLFGLVCVGLAVFLTNRRTAANVR